MAIKEQEIPAAINQEELQSLEAEVLGDIKTDAAAVGEGPAVAVDEEMRGLIGGVLGMGFAVLAPNWQIRPEEVEQLTDVYSALLSKYCPDGLGNYGVEISALMLTAAVIGPRLGTPRLEIPAPKGKAEAMPDVLSGEVD